MMDGSHGSKADKHQASHALHNPLQPYWQITVTNKTVKLDNEKA